MTSSRWLCANYCDHWLCFRLRKVAIGACFYATVLCSSRSQSCRSRLSRVAELPPRSQCSSTRGEFRTDAGQTWRTFCLHFLFTFQSPKQLYSHTHKCAGSTPRDAQFTPASMQLGKQMTVKAKHFVSIALIFNINYSTIAMHF